ncbi:MAG: hypothetical protein ACLTBV_16725 [Enterocloster bolteae]
MSMAYCIAREGSFSDAKHARAGRLPVYAGIDGCVPGGAGSGVA